MAWDDYNPDLPSSEAESDCYQSFFCATNSDNAQECTYLNSNLMHILLIIYSVSTSKVFSVLLRIDHRKKDEICVLEWERERETDLKSQRVKRMKAVGCWQWLIHQYCRCCSYNIFHRPQVAKIWFGVSTYTCHQVTKHKEGQSLESVDDGGIKHRGLRFESRLKTKVLILD